MPMRAGILVRFHHAQASQADIQAVKAELPQAAPPFAGDTIKLG